MLNYKINLCDLNRHIVTMQRSSNNSNRKSLKKCVHIIFRIKFKLNLEQMSMEIVMKILYLLRTKEFPF